jgi:hypothetical protein
LFQSGLNGHDLSVDPAEVDVCVTGIDNLGTVVLAVLLDQ